MQLELIRSSHSVGRNLWVFEWCTKYCYRMMRKWENMKLVEACIRQAAHRQGIKIMKIKVLHEHIHMVTSLPKGMKEEDAVRLMKGGSSRNLFQVKERFGLIYPRHHFWSRGYFAHTAGVTDLQTQLDYAESQESHHGVLYLS